MPPSLARSGTRKSRLPSGMELSCSIPILSSLPKSELIPLWQGEQEEEAEARSEELCPWSALCEFLSPHITSWELQPVPDEDGVPGPGLCVV